MEYELIKMTLLAMCSHSSVDRVLAMCSRSSVDRAPAMCSGGHGFDSSPCVLVAQWIERRPCVRKVMGLILRHVFS